MTGKNSSIIVTVDISCCRCHDKMKKILCNCEGRWCIQSVVWDKEENKITLTGPFCPDELAKELRRKAGDCIKDIKTVDPTPPPPNTTETKPPAKPKTDPKPVEVEVTVKPVVLLPLPVWPTCCCCRPSHKGHGQYCGCRGKPGHRHCGCGGGCHSGGCHSGGCGGSCGCRGKPGRPHCGCGGGCDSGGCGGSCSGSCGSGDCSGRRGSTYDGCRVEFSYEEEPSWCVPM